MVSRFRPEFTSRWRAFAAVVVLGCTLGSPKAEAAHPFYENLLSDGSLAYSQGQYSQAMEYFRIAGFGFLEEPNRLAESLIRQALCHAQLDQPGEFRSVFQRIAQVDRRFGSVEEAALPSELKTEFEAYVVRWVPLEALAGSSLQALANEQRRVEVAKLPAKQRRGALEELQISDPQNPAWPLLQAYLEQEEGRPYEAVKAFNRVLVLDPENNNARCHRGRLSAQLDSCATALDDLAVCAHAPVTVREAVAHLTCLEQARRWGESTDLINSLPAPLQAHRKIERIRRRVEAAAGPAAAANAMPGEPGTPPDPATGMPN